ncbi:MAG: segregation/condensation protein A [Phycisphaerales bacterium]|jgi:segregation and condensation protein A|nr:segregation/condensation protein A [Phycisphaerales bacterium]
MNAPQPTQKDYRVSLEAFEGPLDLLLFLVRRAEVDLQDIPIGQITDQYLEVLRRTGETDVDIEQAGEFLVMAATLVEIKSRTLTPPEAKSASDEGGDEDADPRDALIRQLLAYQRIRRAAELLDEGRREFDRRGHVSIGYERGHLPVLQEGLELDDVHAMDLAEGYERIASAIDFSRLGDHVVEMDDTPIALYEQDLVDRLRRRSGQPLTLQDAFAGQTPAQRIGMFLAVLELVRRFEVGFDQESSGPIRLVLREGEASSVSEDAVASSVDDAPLQ